jgi:hypothetical protein
LDAVQWQQLEPVGQVLADCALAASKFQPQHLSHWNPDCETEERLLPLEI